MRSLVIILIVILLSCKKEAEVNIIPTIYPLPYLPVYPGSKWVYLDENNDTVIQTTDSIYRLHSYKSYNLHGDYTDPVYVPFWNGLPVYGYSSPRYDISGAFDEGQRGEKQVGFLSQEPGAAWRLYANQYGVYDWRVVINVDTTITVSNFTFEHVIVVADSGFIAILNRSYLECLSFYAKDVGLVKTIGSYNWVNYDKLRILSYHINR